LIVETQINVISNKNEKKDDLDNYPIVIKHVNGFQIVQDYVKESCFKDIEHSYQQQDEDLPKVEIIIDPD
jgi:hypothetical protein